MEDFDIEKHQKQILRYCKGDKYKILWHAKEYFERKNKPFALELLKLADEIEMHDISVCNLYGKIMKYNIVDNDYSKEYKDFFEKRMGDDFCYSCTMNLIYYYMNNGKYEKAIEIMDGIKKKGMMIDVYLYGNCHYRMYDDMFKKHNTDGEEHFEIAKENLIMAYKREQIRALETLNNLYITYYAMHSTISTEKKHEIFYWRVKLIEYSGKFNMDNLKSLTEYEYYLQMAVIKVVSESAEAVRENSLLKHHIDELQDIIDVMPGGCEYNEAKERFESMQGEKTDNAKI